MKSKTELINEWIEKADHDLETAKIINNHLPGYNDIISFHCQQAVEKYLKGYLVFLETKFRYTHDLEYLLDLVAQHLPVEDDHYQMAIVLQQFAVEVRYPEGRYHPDRAKMEELIKYAERFREFVMDKIKNTKPQ